MPTNTLHQNKARPDRTKEAAHSAEKPSDYSLFIWITGIFTVFLAGFQAYAPALHGQFVFDDLFLPYTKPHAALLRLADWCGLRPVLGFSFFANYEAAGSDTFPYHVVNVVLHSLSAILVFFFVRRIAEWAGTLGLKSYVLGGFASGLFLLHPAQTEAVAYIASRSENLSVFFIFSALCLFVYRKSASINWLASVSVLVLFACAVGTKEHALALPAVLLLTDYFWNPGFSFTGIRKNWRLYIPVAILGCAAVIFIWSYVSRDPTIGFHREGLTWYQYFFTECRAVLGYMGLFLAPFWLNVDHDFPPSLTLLEHASFAALGLLVLLAGAAIYFRRRYPLASYGFLLFLILLAPTSSVVPIRDVFVERRLYLPFVGLVFVVLEGVRRLRISERVLAAGLAGICLFLGFLTWRRAAVWTSATRLWEDSAAKSPGKKRARVGLGNAYMHENRCQEAAREYSAAYGLGDPEFTLKYNLAGAYDCARQPARALPLLNEALAENPDAAPAYALLGKILGEGRAWEQSLDALKRAEQIDSAYAPAFAYHGVVLMNLGQGEEAGKYFEECLRLDPRNELANRGWAMLNGGTPPAGTLLNH